MRQLLEGGRVLSAPLNGIRVIEVANWLAAPAATRLMADLGADVIKVEPPAGDMLRHFALRSLGYDYQFTDSPAFEVDNFGKRSITIDLEKPGGPELVKQLAADCDIFVLNLTRARRDHFGLGFNELAAINPRVVYASLTAYGSEGPDQDRGGFDYAAFWARSGIMSLLGEPSEPPPSCRAGQGDHSTALNLLAAVLIGLRQRDATGEAQHVELSLQGTGLWSIAGDASTALVAGQNPPRVSRDAPTHPLRNVYRCGDDRWVLLVNPSPFPDRWPAFCSVLGHPEWAGPGYWDSMDRFIADSASAVAAIDPVMATRSLADWGADFDRNGIIWAPVATLLEALNDPQVREMGWVTKTEGSFGPIETLNAPFKVYGADVGIRGPAPRPGQHTFDVLADLGIDDDTLDRLASDGVLG